MKNFIKSMLSDEKGAVSSKRVCGFLCTLCLCGTLVITKVTNKKGQESDRLIECVTALAFGCLGLTTIDKFSIKKTNNE